MLRKHQARTELSQSEKSPFCRGRWVLVHQQDPAVRPHESVGQNPGALSSPLDFEAHVVCSTDTSSFQDCSWRDPGLFWWQAESLFMSTSLLDNTDEAVGFYPLFSSFQYHPCRLYTQVFHFFSWKRPALLVLKKTKTHTQKSLRQWKSQGDLALAGVWTSWFQKVPSSLNCCSVLCHALSTHM